MRRSSGCFHKRTRFASLHELRSSPRDGCRRGLVPSRRTSIARRHCREGTTSKALSIFTAVLATSSPTSYSRLATLVAHISRKRGRLASSMTCSASRDAFRRVQPRRRRHALPRARVEEGTVRHGFLANDVDASGWKAIDLSSIAYPQRTNMLLSPAASRTGRAGHAWVDSNMRSGSDSWSPVGRLRRRQAVSYLERTITNDDRASSSGSTHGELSGCRGSNCVSPSSRCLGSKGSSHLRDERLRHGSLTSFSRTVRRH